MKKFKFGLSFLLVVFLCAVSQKFLLLINYILALSFHELAHLLVATRRGYSIKEFKINMFGVAIELNEQIDDKDSFAINMAGPACNLILCVVCVALYWLIPASFQILNKFCVSNLILAVFNLLPIYPLDGGKVFSSLISNKRHKVFNKMVKLILTVISLIFFVVSCFYVINFCWLLLAVFFFTTDSKNQTKLSLFKHKKESIEKVKLLKITGTETLFQLLKLIGTKHYTIFYCNKTKSHFVDEDEIINLSTKHPLLTTIEEIIWL